MRPAVNVASVIDDSPISRLQMVLVAGCFLIMMFDGFDTQSIAFIAPAIASEWHLSSGTFGPIFAAALLGSIIGGMLLGSLSDRLGRRKMLAFCLLVFGSLNTACALATSIESLTILRFLCGIGLGGAMPNLLAMVAEFAPARRRATLVAMTFCGFALGAVLGGLVSIPLIAKFGWPSVMLVGGILPICTAPLVLLMFPESIKFLMLLPDRGPAVAAILRRIDSKGDFPDDTVFVLNEEKVGRAKVRALFRNGLAAGSIFLTLALFMSLLVVYCLINWIPLLLNRAGLPLNNALMGTILFNLAGILGSFLCTWMIDTKLARPLSILIVAYFLGAISVVFIGVAGITFWPLMISIFISGFLIIGVQLSLTAVIANYYPTALRGTGMGWSIAVGRFGSLSGPLVGGVLIASGTTPSMMFVISALAPLCAGLSLFAFLKLSRDDSATPTAQVPMAISSGKPVTGLSGPARL
jgi:AAHS family 4-hydroxybenzoate transporter-like MFS transporter